MICLDALKRQIGQFRKEEEGASQSVEFLLSFPLLVWAMLATLQYFDAFRTKLISTKATMTIADMFSRETGYVDNIYLNGTEELFKYLTYAESSPDFRVTVVYWDATEAAHKVVWSKNRTSLGDLDNAKIGAYFDVIPVMGDGERAIMVETVTDYSPKFGTGIGEIFRMKGLEPSEIRSLQVIRPRFAPTVCWDDSPASRLDALC